MTRKFIAARVGQTMNRMVEIPWTARNHQAPPCWLSVVNAIPPTETLVRPIPVAHQLPDPKMRKPRNTFRPQKIVYEEDELRQTFFRDHPWELARPRVVLETDGKDARRYDWSRGLIQPGLPLCGECVVQRQMWMMHSGGMTKEQAYDAARREFYALRHREEVERRVAQEEARMVGAYFGKSTLQFGMDVEDKTYERWKAWAAKETARVEADRNRNVAFGFNSESEAPATQEGASKQAE